VRPFSKATAVTSLRWRGQGHVRPPEDFDEAKSRHPGPANAAKNHRTGCCRKHPSSGRLAMIRGRPFERGNKFGRGRPPGSRNRKTTALQKLLDDYSPALLRKSVALALQGDVPLLRMFVDRMLPAPAKIGRLSGGAQAAPEDDGRATWEEFLRIYGER
jgi:hypothetical protein